VYAAVGIHPHEAVAATPEAMDELRLLARQTKVVAIGETGLDWHRNLAPRQAQIAAFSAHLAVAAELDLPVIIHSREADADVLAVWRTVPGGRGVLHAFSGDSAMAEAALAEGLYIAFGGPLTYKNAEAKRAIARQIPLDRLLIETDCPLLPPVPWRGRRNEPAYVALVNEALAHVLGRPAQDMGAQATRNAQALFKLPDRVEDR
jgi:TatD DNase family protein